MIRILHFADLHLGVENYGKVDPTTGLSSRVRDFLDRLDELVSFALAEHVDVVTFAGDAFRNRHPEPTYQRDFARRVAHLAREGIRVVLVAGNHDLPAMLVKATSVDIFHALEVENVYVSARTEEVLRIPLRRKREIQVATYPYPNRSRLLLSEEYRRRPLREQEEFLRVEVARGLSRLVEQLDRERPAVLVAHLAVQGGQLGSEQGMTLGGELEALLATVAHPAYDAVLLGHMHRNQVLRSEAPLVLYPGSLERVDFGDEGIEKGFYLVEIDEKARPEAADSGRRPLSHRFVALPARPFVTVDIDARRGDPQERTLQAIQEAREAGKLAGAVVRLRLQVRQEDAGRLDFPALRRALEEAFFVAAVAVEVERPERAAFRGSLEQLSPLEALERYWISREVPAKRRETLLRSAQELMDPEG